MDTYEYYVSSYYLFYLFSLLLLFQTYFGRGPCDKGAQIPHDQLVHQGGLGSGNPLRLEKSTKSDGVRFKNVVFLRLTDVHFVVVARKMASLSS